MSEFPLRSESPQSGQVPNLLPRNRQVRVAIIVTIVGVIAYALGAMMHSEIWHFFLEALK